MRILLENYRKQFTDQEPNTNMEVFEQEPGH